MKTSKRSSYSVIVTGKNNRNTRIITPSLQTRAFQSFSTQFHFSTQSAFLNDTITFCFCLSHWESSSFLCICVTCRCWELSAGNIKWIYQVPILTAIGVRVLHLLLPINAAWKFTRIHFCKKGQSSIISLQAFEFLACNLKGLKFPSMNTNNLLLSTMKHRWLILYDCLLKCRVFSHNLWISNIWLFKVIKRELWFYALDAVTTRWNSPIKANKISSFVTCNKRNNIININ